MTDTRGGAGREARTLDEAWIAAEVALGEYWRIRSLVEIKDGWEAVATDGRRIETSKGETPLEALQRFVR